MNKITMSKHGIKREAFSVSMSAEVKEAVRQYSSNSKKQINEILEDAVIMYLSNIADELAGKERERFIEQLITPCMDSEIFKLRMEVAKNGKR